jgi:hypothetical protein
VLPALLLLIAEPHVINLQERVPLTLVVSTPTGQVADISKSELIRIASDLVKRHTDFFPQDLDELVVEECKGRLTCLALKSREGEEGSEGLEDSKYLLLISNVSIPDGADRLSMVLLDVENALQIHRDAVRKVGWQDEVEATVSEEAVIAPPIRSEVRDAQEAETFLATAFTRELARGLEDAGHWEPYGDIEIECAHEGAVIKLDGNGLGSTAKGVTQLSRARPGPRTLEVEQAGYAPFSTVVEVSRGATARVSVDLVALPSNTTGIVRQAVAWSGVAVGAVGVALSIFGAVKKGNAETGCFSPCDTGSQFITFGYDPAEVGSTSNINPPGVAILPLGVALAGTGLTWSLGSWLFADDGDIPWIQLLVGAAVGGATYAIMVLADGSTPEAQ